MPMLAVTDEEPCDASFSQEVFNIAVAEIEAVITPYSLGNDIRWEAVSFVGVHGQILLISVT